MRQVLSVVNKNYDILITDDDFSKLVEELKAFINNRRAFYVVNKKVFNMCKLFF